jgi:molecular chaperone GrpE
MVQTVEDEWRNTIESQDPDLFLNEEVEGEVPQLSGENDSTDPLTLCRNQCSDLQEKHLRLVADLENMRRRSVQDTEMQVNRAITAFARDLLEVADNFERALTAQECQIPEGILYIKKQFDTALEKQGIVAFSSSGEQFDPALHEAIAYVPSKEPQGTVIDEISRGYTRYDRIIRCAKVTVSRGADESNAQENNVS